MAEDVIKKIRLSDSNDEFKIGADAQDIDYNENIKLTEVIGNNLNEVPLSERIQSNENFIADLTDAFNEVSLQILNLNTFVETQNQKIQQLQEENEDLALKILKLKQPTTANSIEWSNTVHMNLREILGNLVNVPYGSVRNWLENLQNKNINNGSNNNGNNVLWHSIATEEGTSTNEEGT